MIGMAERDEVVDVVQIGFRKCIQLLRHGLPMMDLEVEALIASAFGRCPVSAALLTCEAVALEYA